MDIENKEVWRPVIGYEEQYEVSNFGDIRRIRKPFYRFVDSHGYYLVRISKNGCIKSHKLHTLIAAAFHEQKPEGSVIHHIDNNKLNNNANNLEYLTRSEHARRKRPAFVIEFMNSEKKKGNNIVWE